MFGFFFFFFSFFLKNTENAKTLRHVRLLFFKTVFCTKNKEHVENTFDLFIFFGEKHKKYKNT